MQLEKVNFLKSKSINKKSKTVISKVLEKLRGKQNQALIKQEIDELKQEKEAKMKQKEVSYTDLFKKPSLRKALIVSVM